MRACWERVVTAVCLPVSVGMGLYVPVRLSVNVSSVAACLGQSISLSISQSINHSSVALKSPLCIYLSMLSFPLSNHASSQLSIGGGVQEGRRGEGWHGMGCGSGERRGGISSVLAQGAGAFVWV